MLRDLGHCAFSHSLGGFRSLTGSGLNGEVAPFPVIGISSVSPNANVGDRTKHLSVGELLNQC